MAVEIADIAQDEILTGEAVALDVQPVGFLLRALGALIDLLAGVALVVVFVLVVVWTSEQGLDPSLLPILTIVLLVMVAVVLPTVVETVSGGRSLGKLAVGGRIVRADGGAAGFRHALLRALVGVLEIWMTAGAVAAIVGLFTPRAQRLGDLVAGTYAERTRAPRLVARVPAMPPVLADWARVADVAALPLPLARRLASFVAQAPQLDPAARHRIATDLAAETRTHVSPVPAVDAETFLRGVAAVRYARELHAVRARDARAAALLR
ncbi:RDD family protein [Microbacterium sp. SORGH_AS_0888]|uniref:RDD family protein n=1 Tax=Microbacterium sp. SORGH_AS_0888 TaxID=3041791 RepID=UPI002784045E|nr:RDD family protein [Microbacterium sp. SORGH_AS_0888]MDQ1127910.1 putative RDD family membrane protein YckC [Microbacterium sp. SORGH_AS_0888]